MLGSHCSVGSDSTVERSVLHDRVVVGPDCTLREAVLADRVRAGDGVRVEPGAVVGSDAQLGDGAVVERRTPCRARDGDGVTDPMLGDVLAQPHQLGDALWRVEAAAIPAGERRGGLVVCGMGGSAVGGDLAAAAIGDRATAPIRVARGYAPGPGVGADTLVLCASYSGSTEETLACFEAAGAPRARRAWR